MHAGPSLAPVGHVRWRRNRVVIRTGSGGGSGYAYEYAYMYYALGHGKKEFR